MLNVNLMDECVRVDSRHFTYGGYEADDLDRMYRDCTVFDPDTGKTHRVVRVCTLRTRPNPDALFGGSELVFRIDRPDTSNSPYAGHDPDDEVWDGDYEDYCSVSEYNRRHGFDTPDSDEMELLPASLAVTKTITGYVNSSYNAFHLSSRVARHWRKGVSECNTTIRQVFARETNYTGESSGLDLVYRQVRKGVPRFVNHNLTFEQALPDIHAFDSEYPSFEVAKCDILGGERISCALNTEFAIALCAFSGDLLLCYRGNVIGMLNREDSPIVRLHNNYLWLQDSIKEIINA